MISESHLGKLHPKSVTDSLSSNWTDSLKTKRRPQGRLFYDGWLWKLRGPTGTDRPWGQSCGSGKRMSAKRSKRSLGKRNNGCISAIESCWPRVRTKVL